MDKEQQEVVDGLMKHILVIDHHMVTPVDYRNLVTNYYDAIKSGFEHEECRRCPIRFKFHEEDREIHTLELRHFITNLFLWEPFARLETYDDINADCIVDCTTISTDSIKDFLDDKIIKPYRKDVGNYKLNKITHDVVYNLGRISSDFNELLGLTMNIESFMQISDRNPRFNELIRTKVDESMQPQDVETMLTALTAETIGILKEEDGCLKPILQSGTGIKDGQLKEFVINGGLTAAPYINIRKAS